MLNDNHLIINYSKEEGLSKEALGDVLLQDKFQVWDSKQLIKKAKDRHVFLFETSLVFAKEIKDQKGKLKYIYKFKLMVYLYLIHLFNHFGFSII
jgi:hypothetical protein